MAVRSRARFALFGLLLVLPLAAAQAPLPLPTSPTVPTAPPGTPDPSAPLSIQDGPLTFLGPADAPTLVRLTHEGQTAFEYSVGSDGRARIVAGDKVLLQDATLVRVEGDPLGDSFTLVLRDAEGREHKQLVARPTEAEAILLQLPPEARVAFMERPEGYPGGPDAPYLVYVQSGGIHLGASELTQAQFARRSGAHVAGLQVPLADGDWDRVWLVASLASGANQSANFQVIRTTDTASVYRAEYFPALLRGAVDGSILELDVNYERRLAPIVVERFVEAADYRYKLDATGPTVAAFSAAEADSFAFEVAWSGEDKQSGLGGFDVDWRKQGATTWTRWLPGTPATSAVFSGDWGQTYEFRVTALDRVGNPSQPATTTTRVLPQPAQNLDINDAPTARLLTPRAGSTLAGDTLVTWRASDPDGMPVTSTLEMSADDGETWRKLYVGVGERFVWNVAKELDGADYRLRLTVSDGSQNAADAVGALTVRNVVAPVAPPSPSPAPTAPTSVVPTSGGATGGATDTGASGEAGGEAAAPGKKVPGVGAVVLVALVGALALLRRR